MKQATHRRSMRVQYLVLTLLLSVGLCLLSGTLMAQEGNVTPLMSEVLTDISGKEVPDDHSCSMRPAGRSPIHRHNAHAFVYVLEGSIVMQVQGGKQVTLTPGQTFNEGPNDVHVVSRNASNTEPAKFLVVLVKDKGAPVVVPVK